MRRGGTGTSHDAVVSLEAEKSASQLCALAGGFMLSDAQPLITVASRAGKLANNINRRCRVCFPIAYLSLYSISYIML